MMKTIYIMLFYLFAVAAGVLQFYASTGCSLLLPPLEEEYTLSVDHTGCFESMSDAHPGIMTILPLSTTGDRREFVAYFSGLGQGIFPALAEADGVWSYTAWVNGERSALLRGSGRLIDGSTAFTVNLTFTDLDTIELSDGGGLSISVTLVRSDCP
jgi:hypothetical protein